MQFPYHPGKTKHHKTISNTASKPLFALYPCMKPSIKPLLISRPFLSLLMKKWFLTRSIKSKTSKHASILGLYFAIFANSLMFQHDYSYLSNKRRVANNRRVWKKYLNLINEGSGTNGGPGIFVTLCKEAFDNSHFIRFSPHFFNDFFSKIYKRRVFHNCVGPGIFFQKE